MIRLELHVTWVPPNPCTSKVRNTKRKHERQINFLKDGASFGELLTIVWSHFELLSHDTVTLFRLHAEICRTMKLTCKFYYDVNEMITLNNPKFKIEIISHEALPLTWKRVLIKCAGCSMGTMQTSKHNSKEPACRQSTILCMNTYHQQKHQMCQNITPYYLRFKNLFWICSTSSIITLNIY